MTMTTAEVPISWDNWVEITARRLGVDKLALCVAIKDKLTPNVLTMYQKVCSVPRLAQIVLSVTPRTQNFILDSVQEGTNVQELEAFWSILLELQNDLIVSDFWMLEGVDFIEDRLDKEAKKAPVEFLKSLALFMFLLPTPGTRYHSLVPMLLRLKYGDGLLVEVMKRCTDQQVQLTLSEFKKLVETWDNVKQFSIDWAIMLNKMEGDCDADD